MNKENPTILIAGYEIGGQMQLLAESFRKRWIHATSVAYNIDFRGYQNDINLSGKGIKGSFKRLFFFIFAIIHYDIFHFFWGVSLLSIWRFHLIDLPILKLFNKKIVVHFRGLDVVDIKHFDYLRRVARGENITPPPMSRPDQQKKLKKWIKYADEILVSEPDLFDVVPKGRISPQVINMKYWKPVKKVSRKEIFRIVHAPSSRRKKGTDFIEESIQKLREEGYNIELLMAENLPFHKIKDIYAMADIGIDQVLYGWHGKVSVELMAMGIPVLCYINPNYAKHRLDLPIINCNIQNLADIIRDCIDGKYNLEKIGSESHQYAYKYHDLESITDDLLEVYNLSIKTRVQTDIIDIENKKW